ncbi:PilZ domain-containing protein [Alicyclobacillus fastidiosus]|uniref:PilZ domain-containing protein n=1 Tax=Alicyclobacillus fastidiosus TaxID=392011 RepID=A0ABY6ZBM8_9BACL|nr:PilZ domain-containing protein [Alicyclobacillus fastidiosus]WAH39614.1 PilZ domain-containing protein [Alicyclobacillus fastidiosus]GMA60821.1 flagellar protein [Alicyclobacillus fastidiosus]
MAVRPSVGTPVRIKLSAQDSSFYKTRVADVDDRFLYIDVPVNPLTGRELEVRVDHDLLVEYAASGSEVYRYTAQMLGIAYIPTPAVRLSGPEGTRDLERIQRREFFRISIDTSVQLVRQDDGLTYHAQSLDISGGGLAVKSREAVDYRPDDIVKATLTLPYTGDTLNATCRIVRVEVDDASQERVVSMAFEDIKERERQQVVRYTFMRQRSLKR